MIYYNPLKNRRLLLKPAPNPEAGSSAAAIVVHSRPKAAQAAMSDSRDFQDVARS